MSKGVGICPTISTISNSSPLWHLKASQDPVSPKWEQGDDWKYSQQRWLTAGVLKAFRSNEA